MADARRKGMTCRWCIGVFGLLTFVLSACSGGLIGGAATMPTVDPREAFGAFAHPAQPWDKIPEKLLDPELNDPDIRKVGSWAGADVTSCSAHPPPSA